MIARPFLPLGVALGVGLFGCGKGTKGSAAEGDAAATAAPSAEMPTAAGSPAAMATTVPSSIGHGAPKASASAFNPLQRPCPKGTRLLGSPTDPKLPCMKPCTTTADCPKGTNCTEEDAFGGTKVKVCDATASAPSEPTAAQKKPLAVPSPSTDRFARNRDKDGPCPAGFVEQPGAEANSTCARECKKDADYFTSHHFERQSLAWRGHSA